MTLATVNITVRLNEQDGDPIPDAEIVVKLNATDRTPLGTVAPVPQTFYTDEDGLAVMALVPNSAGLNGTQYLVTATHPETGKKIYNQKPFTVFSEDAYLDTLFGDSPVATEAFLEGALEVFQQYHSDLSELSPAMDSVIAIGDEIVVVAGIAAAVVAAPTHAATAATGASTATTAATTATTQASTATTAAATATTQAGIATTKAGEASTSATTATTGATTATTQAATATTQAGIATTKAGEASTSATTATTGATTATTQAGVATTAAATATTQAGISTTQAGISTTKAGEAGDSAAAAVSAKTLAEAARDAALAAFDNFDDKYLGQKTDDPTLDNDGNALVSGALYFNSVEGVMRVYDGADWLAAYASLEGALLVSNNLSDLSNVPAARTSLGLGTAATTAATAYATSAQGATADTALQPGSIGVSVQAYSAILAGTTASFTTAIETKLGHITVTQAVDLDTIESNLSGVKTKVDHITITQAVDLDAIETRVNELDAAVIQKGPWDASAGTFPGSGAAQNGWTYIVTVAGTVDGVAFSVNDRVMAYLDNASTTTYASNWLKLDYTDQVLSVAGKTGAVTLDKADVGLSNVDNTSDADKPVSDATQTALDGKASTSHNHAGTYQPLATVLTNTTASFLTAQETQLGYITVTQAVDLDTIESNLSSVKTKVDHVTVTQAVDLDAIETRVNELDAAVIQKGPWDASAGTFPGSGAAQNGWSYVVTVAGTVDGVSFAVNDRLLAYADNASTTTYASNWLKLDYTDQVLSVAGKTGTVTIDKTDVGLSNVDNTSNATNNSATATLTNKRITKRVGTTASSSTPTPDADAHDVYTVTAQAASATFGAPSGTPTDGQPLSIRIKDNGTARSLAYNSVYRASTDLPLPSTTVISKTLYLGFIYNSADSKWDLVAVLNNV